MAHVVEVCGRECDGILSAFLESPVPRTITLIGTLAAVQPANLSPVLQIQHPKVFSRHNENPGSKAGGEFPATRERLQRRRQVLPRCKGLWASRRSGTSKE
jgi:hypothetical protein